MVKAVVKRDGKIEKFNKDKIVKAILNAGGSLIEASTIAVNVELGKTELMNIEDIQDTIEKALDSSVKECYSNYRKERTRAREIKSAIMQTISKIGVETDRDNANVGNNYSSKLLRIASESNKWHNLAVMPKDISKAHEIGEIYHHDLDSFNLTTNCLHVPISEVLDRGFNTGYGTINSPKRIGTAAELCCIVIQSSQNDLFGGQSFADFDNDLAPYVDITRKEIREEYKELGITDEKLIERKLLKEVHQAMQGVVYNLNSMHSRAGSQVVFSSINLGIPRSKDAALICKVFLEEYKKGLGKGEQPIFPNIIFRVKEGVNREVNDPYYYLYQLACEVAAKRMNPTFMNIDADFNKEYYDKGYVPATMGCRTYIMSNVNGEPGADGRGNIAPTTINLPRIGIQAKGNVENFFEIFDERINLAKRALLYRYDVLKKLKVKDLPFVAGQNLMKGSEGLSKDDSIEPILKQGTWAIGFIGLAECLTALTGKHHGESEESRELGIKIITHLREKCNEFTKETHLNWSCYATPAEGLSGKFIKLDKAKFGIIKGVTDKDYYTNSYHIPVGYMISIVNKIKIEAPYHKLCNAGHISYVELDKRPTGEQIQSIVDFAYKNTNISYIGINFHIRYCKTCGGDVENYEKKCSNCGSTEIQGISRVTGYLSLDERFGPGKVAERADRKGLDDNKYVYRPSDRY